MRERGLKILFFKTFRNFLYVAPVRERGLKTLSNVGKTLAVWCRSREGAWIEKARTLEGKSANSGRSREGAWIEKAAIGRRI